MLTAATKKVNKRVSYVPRDLLGKPNENGTVGAFTTPLGSRFTATKILSLGFIYTESVMFGSLHTMPYSEFMSELHFSRDTVSRNLRELRESGIIERPRQSKYKFEPDFAQGQSFPVYHFLLEEKIDFGGVVKRLSYNAVLYLCEIINFYLTPINKRKNNKQKYFIGGNRRASKTLNIVPGTAHGIIDDLLGTKAIFRHQLSYDSAGNEIISGGKGDSRKTLTVYVVNSNILRLCSAILKEMEDIKALKKLGKKIVRSKQDEEGEYNQRNFPSNSIKNRSHYDKYNLAEQKFLELEIKFAYDDKYQELKRQYAVLYDSWFEVLKKYDYD